MLEASFNTRGTEGPVAVFLSYWSLFILWFIIQCLYALHFYDYTIADFFSLSVRRVRCYFCTDLKVSSNLKLSLKMHDCKTRKMNKAASATVAPLAASDLQCVSKESYQWCHLLSAQSQFPCPVLLPSRCNWTNATNQQPSERTVAAWGFAGSRPLWTIRHPLPLLLLLVKYLAPCGVFPSR